MLKGSTTSSRSARYSKALETIRKLKVEYGNKSKDVKADLEGLKAHMEAASGFKGTSLRSSRKAALDAASTS